MNKTERELELEKKIEKLKRDVQYYEEELKKNKKRFEEYIEEKTRFPNGRCIGCSGSGKKEVYGGIIRCTRCNGSGHSRI